MNHAPRRVVSSLWPDDQIPYLYYIQINGIQMERGIGYSGAEWVAQGPRETIGDLLRLDAVHGNGWPGKWMGEFGWHVDDANYSPSANRVGEGPRTWHGYGKYPNTDDDGDGIRDERDERDFWFTQACNFTSTRSHTFTIEIVTQVAEPPYYQAHMSRPTYNSDRVHAEKHLLLLADRSTTLRIGKTIGADGKERLGPCDFTGPVEILARRWAHQRR
jgi:hypothetical protein